MLLVLFAQSYILLLTSIPANRERERARADLGHNAQQGFMRDLGTRNVLAGTRDGMSTNVLPRLDSARASTAVRYQSA